MELEGKLGNYLALRILAVGSGNGTDNKFNFKSSSAEGGLKLTVEPGLTLTSPNAAARFVSVSAGNSVTQDVDLWLEWDSAQLQPQLAKVYYGALGAGKLEKDALSGAKTTLQALDTALKGKAFITGKEVSVADFAVWSTLYPASLKDKMRSDLLCGEVGRWFATVNDLPAAKAAVATVKIDNDSVSPLEAPERPAGGADYLAGLASAAAKHQKQQQQAAAQQQKTEGGAPAAASNEVNWGSVSAEDAASARLAWSSCSSTPLTERAAPLLPEAGQKNVLITSALPYVNNVPHLGNIIGCVLSADVFARFCRLRDYNTLYVCGTDEYGTATETKALEEGLTPQQICDKYNALHTKIYDWFNINFDIFGRTTTPQQQEIAQDIYKKCEANGAIFTDSVDQLHCEKCDKFLADRFVEGQCPMCWYEDARGDQCDSCGKLINAVELIRPRCKVCSSAPTVRTSNHLFLDLPKTEPRLLEWLKTREGEWSSNSDVISRSWIRDGLKPRCITRDLKWGVPVPKPGFTDKVFYVWFDAPIGYLSITACYTPEWEKWWKNPEQVEHYEFMAKDNVPFHSIMFPSTLLAADDNYVMVHHLFATEYLNYEDGKFSKSRGVGVFGNNAQDTGVPADVWRFYLLYIRPENQDSAFSWDDFAMKNNSELLNNLGNFVNRALAFCKSTFGGRVGAVTLTQGDAEVLALITQELQAYTAHLHKARLRDGLRNILAISRLGNQMMQANKPWVLVKGSAEERARGESVVSLAVNISALIAIMVEPYMPQVATTVRQQLNYMDRVALPEVVAVILPEGHVIGQPSPLFSKIEDAQIRELKKMFAGKQVASPAAAAKAGKKTASGSGAAAAAGPAELERLSAAVTAQGTAVRELKTAKSDKAEVDAAVAELLSLKKQLALAQGLAPDALTGGDKKGKKK